MAAEDSSNRWARYFRANGLFLDRERFDERAAIMENDGGLDQAAAEYRAALSQWVDSGKPGYAMRDLGAMKC